MVTVLLAIGGFLAAVALISVGVLLGKRTPLRGSCASVGSVPHGPEERCDECTCGVVPQTGVPPGGEVACDATDPATHDRVGRSER